MEQASAWHCCMVPQAATLATLVGISHSSAKRCKRKPKTTGHDGKGKRKPQTQNSDHKKPRSNHSGRQNGRFQCILVDKGPTTPGGVKSMTEERNHAHFANTEHLEWIFRAHSFVIVVFAHCFTAHGHFRSKHIQFRVHCMNDALRTHLLKNSLRTVTVIRARARLSVLVRHCARSFQKNTQKVDSDTDVAVVFVKHSHTPTLFTSDEPKV